MQRESIKHGKLVKDFGYYSQIEHEPLRLRLAQSIDTRLHVVGIVSQAIG